MKSKKRLTVDQPPMAEEGIFDDFKVDLAELKPKVREKAIELARELTNKGMAKEQAIRKGIQKAETWFLESQG